MGIQLDLLAVNHWPIAINSHALNHPGVRHKCESLGTVTTQDRFALVEPKEEGHGIDILFRMLQPHELQAAMSFPKNYKFYGNREQQVKQIGNAVPVMLARAHAEALLRAALPHS